MGATGGDRWELQVVTGERWELQVVTGESYRW